MATLYKLTDQNWETRNHTKWGSGVSHGPLSGRGGLCGPGWLHAYTSPELAVLLNPIHANIVDPVLWRCEGDVGIIDYGLKVGCRTLTTVEQIELPAVSTEQRVRFAILCALEVYKAPAFVKWASDWLSCKDRSKAEAAARAVAEAARAAADAAAWAARAAAWAARAAAEAARAAAEAAAWAGVPLDLTAIAKKALEVQP